MNNKRPLLEIIFNPLAGPADLDRSIYKVADFWRDRGWDVAVQPTQYAGHATMLAREAAQSGHLLVLSGGGDGTLGEAANGLVGSDTILGVLPMGTGNSFAKELHMPRPGMLDHRGLVAASASLATGKVYKMDVGLAANGKHWLLWAGTGMDGFLVNEMEPRSKLIKRLGPVGYGLQAMSLMPRFPGMKAHVRVDDQEYEGAFIMVTVCNCRRFAGGLLELNPQAALDDGRFEVWLVREGSPGTLLRLAMAVRRGRHHDHPGLTVLSGRHVSVTANPALPVHADGDPSGTTPFTSELVPGALRVLIPPSAPPGLFGQPGVSLAETRKVFAQS